MNNFTTVSANKFYGYTTPLHPGYIKIGQTVNNIEDRVKAQCSQSCTSYEIVFKADANGKTDKNFHKFLKKRGYEPLKFDQTKNNEWFRISEDNLKIEYNNFVNDISTELCDEIDGEYTEAMNITLKPSQKEAAKKIIKSYSSRALTNNNKFLLNAKCRFGKTFTVLSVIKELGLEKVLIATQRPAIGNSWYDDFIKIFGSNSIYSFVTKYELAADDAHYITPVEYNKNGLQNEILFMGLADLKGSTKFNKNTHVFDTKWDLIVIDESHNAYDTEKGKAVFDNIETKFTLYLSGTPYRMLAKEDYNDDNMYSWTYEDEQEAKMAWKDEDGENPYADLPRLNMITYRPSEEITRVIDNVNDEMGMKQAFDLSLFFSLNDTKEKFEYEEDVIKFVRNLHENKNYPFASEESRNNLKHTVWKVSGVKVGNLLADILEQDEIFKEYKIVRAIGREFMNDEDITDKDINSAYSAVKDAIANNDKTITITCGQLLEGVTVKEWTAILLLSSGSSKEPYVQSIFRVQNPWKTNSWMKTECYVFDFDFARALQVHSSIANSNNPKSDSEKRKECIKTLLNYFPVLADDENGEMRSYSPDDIVTEPIKMIARDVVNVQFKHNSLFNGFGLNIFDPNMNRILEKINGKSFSDKKNNEKPEAEDLDDTKPLDEQLGSRQYMKLKGAFERIGMDYSDFEDDVYSMAKEYDWSTQMTKDFVGKMDKLAGNINNEEDYKKAEAEAINYMNNRCLDKEEKKENKVDWKRDQLVKFMDAFGVFVTMFEELDMNTIEISFKNLFGEDSEELWEEITNITMDDFITLRDTYNVFNIELFNESFNQFYRIRNSVTIE